MKLRLESKHILPLSLVLATGLGVLFALYMLKPADVPSTPEWDVKSVAALIPKHVPDRPGWAQDVIAAIQSTQRDVNLERVCSVLAIIEQESGYRADPIVANLPQIVRQGLEEKFSSLGPLAAPAVDALLSGKAPGSEESFDARIHKLRTERDLDRLFRDIAEAYQKKLPGTFAVASAISVLLGKGALRDLNPVTTAGSMQVKVDFARKHPSSKGLGDQELREKLYTRAGGVLYGTARLLDFSAAYEDVIYRFADYNAGVYASRNASFQALLSDLSGQALSRDGDLLSYEDDGQVRDVETESLKALYSFAEKEDLSRFFVRWDAKKEKTAAFEKTKTWQRVRDAWQRKTGRHPPYARLPEVALVSPKLARNRSTAWFAAQVKRRYQTCRDRH